MASLMLHFDKKYRMGAPHLQHILDAKACPAPTPVSWLEPKSYPFNWKCDIAIEILWEECSSFRGITSNFTAEILRLI